MADVGGYVELWRSNLRRHRAYLMQPRLFQEIIAIGRHQTEAQRASCARSFFSLLDIPYLSAWRCASFRAGLTEAARDFALSAARQQQPESPFFLENNDLY